MPLCNGPSVNKVLSCLVLSRHRFVDWLKFVNIMNNNKIIIIIIFLKIKN